MTVLIAPKPAIMQKVAQAKIQAEKERQKAEKEGRVLPPEPEDLPSLSDVNKGEEDDEDDEDEAGDDANA
jgi:translation initiation factor IF-3